MGVQAPFDRSQSWFELHKVMKGEVAFAGAYFIKPDSPLDMDNPIAITCIGGPTEMLPENIRDPYMLRAEFQWLVGGCAAFHKVEVRNYIDDPDNPVITPARD